VSAPATGAAAGIDPRVWKVAAAVVMGPFMTLMDSTVVNVSLSTIGQQLHASIATAQWIVSGYLLALALMLPLNGWMVDRVGAKRLYLGCFTAFTAASLLCGAARGIDQLIAARMVQGIAGGLLAPMTQMMIARVATGRHMARVMGYTVVPILIAPILGPVLAGAILKYAAWPWLFYLNVPIGAVGVMLAALLLPPDEAVPRKRPFDLPGFVLISPGLVLLLYGLQHAVGSDGGWALAAGAILLAAFLRHALHKGSAALIDLRLFDNRIFSAAAATQFFSSAQANARQLLVPLYLIAGCAVSASQAGWMMAVLGLGMMCSFPMMGFLTGRYGCRAVSASGALAALLGTLPFLWMVEYRYSPAWALAALFISGAGQGAISIPSVSAAYASVPKDRLPVANTALNIVMRLGGPTATTLVAVVMSLASGGIALSGPRPFMMAFALLAGLHVLGLAAASRLPLQIESNASPNVAGGLRRV